MILIYCFRNVSKVKCIDYSVGWVSASVTQRIGRGSDKLPRSQAVLGYAGANPTYGILRHTRA